METKVCPKCGRELQLSDFHNDKSKKDGKSSYCKECRKEYQKEHQKEYYEKNKEKLKEYGKEYYENNKERRKEYREANKERLKEKNKEYREKNKEKLKEYQKEYYEKNKEKLKEYGKEYQKDYYEKNKERRKEYNKEYYEKNKERKKEYDREYKKEYYKNKRKEDELLAVTIRCRSRIYKFIQKSGYNKTSKTFEMIGCTPEQLVEHLHKTWYDNYGTEYNGEPVHIDHIIPLSSAKTEEDIYKLCHYTNLQYLKPEDNLTKSDSILQTI